MRRLTLLISSLVLLTSARCSDAPDDPDAVETDTGADTLASTSTFFQVRRDLRLCPAPDCGGFFVKQVNASSTKCVDGRSRAECHVATVDLAALGLPPAQLTRFQDDLFAGHGIVRGKLGKRAGVASDKLGALTVSEGWRAATAAKPTGKFFRLQDRGIVCVTAPCFTIHEATLDSTDSTNLSDLDLGPVGASADQLAAARAALKTGGLIIAGKNVTVSLPGPDGKKAIASQLYLRVLRDLACNGLTPCLAGEYCDVTIAGACGEAGPVSTLPGICKPVPAVCPLVAKPVCGCDGKTYGNDCERLAAKVQLDHEGVCGCTSSAQCPAGQVCNVTGDNACGAGALGRCQPPPAICADVLVCGCDGVTYPTDCDRLKAGAALAHLGACTCGGFAGLACGGGQVCDVRACGPDAGGTCVPAPTLCPEVPQCAPPPATCTDLSVCGCDGVTYPTDCDRLKAGAGLAARGACAPKVIECGGTDLEVKCPDGQACNFKFGGCGTMPSPRGVCEAIPDACLDLSDPVCGCDGRTYDNDCLRFKAGVQLASKGACQPIISL